jgi:hypothetical protein
LHRNGSTGVKEIQPNSMRAENIWEEGQKKRSRRLDCKKKNRLQAKERM